MKQQLGWAAIWGLAVAGWSAAALAQSPSVPSATQFVPSSDWKAADPNAAQGWDYTLTFSANFALAQNSNIVGQPEGTSYLFGAGVLGAVQYLNGPHDFRLNLSLVESFSKTPALDALIKTNDLAHLDGIYSYYFVQWLGAFARAAFEAPLLITEDVRANDVDYSITRTDGSTEVLSALRSLRLAKGGQPLTMTQSLGLIAQPYASPPATVTVRVGAGARETLAAGVLIVKDDAGTPAIELMEASDVIQGGLEVAAGLVGAVPEHRLAYGIDLAVLLPFFNNDEEGRSAAALARMGVAGSLTYSMFEWLALKYQLLVQRDPQLVEGIQVQNNLFLTLKYDLVKSKKVAPAKADPVKEAQDARDAAEQRAKEAEDRARAAEQRIQQLEQRQ